MYIKEETAKELFNRLMSVILHGLECPSIHAEMPLNEYLDKYLLYIEARSRRLKASLCVPFYIEVKDMEEELKHMPATTSSSGTQFYITLSDIRFSSNSNVYAVVTDKTSKDGKMAFSLRMQNKNKDNKKVSKTLNYMGDDFLVTDDNVGYSFENCELVCKLFGEDDNDEQFD